MARTRKPSDVAREQGAKIVTVRAVKSFDNVRIGEEDRVPLNERILGLVAGGFLEVTDHGTDPSGPWATGPDHSGGGAPDDPGEGPSGAEPGEGFGAGGYGTAAG